VLQIEKIVLSMNCEQSESSLSSMIATHGDCVDDECGDEMPCICCSGAYESFDSITSVLESKKEIAKKIAEKVTEKEAETCVAVSNVSVECQCGQCSGRAVVACFEIDPWKKYPLGSDEGRLQAVSNWQTLSEDGANAKLPCDLLKSGSATCQCAECCGGAIYDDNHTEGDSVHSEDCLDLLTTTHV
jgi:hypothetical protein